MAYCTQSDVQIAAGGEKNLRALADQDGDGFADDAVITAAISRADSLINVHLAKQVKVPIAAEYVTDEVKNRSAELAVYFMRKQNGTLSEEMVKDHELVLKELGNLATGVLALDADPAPPKHSSRVDQVGARPSSKAVSRRKLDGYS
jgi:phage gp36-like protein